ncbi:oxidoreductase, zinc-binding protein [Hyaloraphidium curvatum]|nr:oxidoreductase, zinc-binding protein [Hyaloraphidium curvatum]
MSPTTGRKWILKARPEPGPLDPSKVFELKEEPLPPLGEGDVLLKNICFSIDPTFRIWMTGDGYMPAVPLGDPMRGASVAEVLESKSPKYQKGDRVWAFVGWQDAFVSKDNNWQLFTKIDPSVSPADFLTMAPSGTGATAMRGIFDVGAAKFEPGATVLVSGAAGSTGSFAVQIYKSLGCRVVGTAGGAAKCAFVKEKLGADECVDYKDPAFADKLKAACPKGIVEYFDNVGGQTLELALDLITNFGRIIYCGNISQYESGDPSQLPGPKNYSQILMKRLRVEGFIVSDKPENTQKYSAELLKMKAAGKLVAEIDDSRSGFENLPKAVQDMFEGKNTGKMVVNNKL